MVLLWFVRYHFDLRCQNRNRLFISNAQSVLSVVTKVLDKCILYSLIVVCFSFYLGFHWGHNNVVKLEMNLGWHRYFRIKVD